MKNSPAMQQIVTQLAKKHGLDLMQPSTHLKLEMEHFDPLVIEKIDRHLLSMAHYYISNGIYKADPEIIFYTGDGQWVPMAVTQMLRGFHIYARFSPKGDLTGPVDLWHQATLADFAEQWATNITDQNWLKDGQCVTLETPNKQRRFPLGRLLVTSGAASALEQAGQKHLEFFARHQSGDYGVLGGTDKQQNAANLKWLDGMIMSAYFLSTNVKIWVITDADWGRTTILLPEEY
jgi:hypothetical protein